MPTDIRVVGQKFYSKLNNGDDFTINDTTDFSQHLKGGVLEEIKAVFNVQVQWYVTIEGGTSLIYHDLSNNTYRLEIDGLDFSNHGFSIGDETRLQDVSFFFEGKVTSLSVGQITIEVTSTNAGDGFSRPSERMFFTGLTKKTALKYDFGLIENNEPINFLSKLTKTTQTYLYEGIDHDNPLTFVQGITQGNNKAAYTGSSQVAFVKYVVNKDEFNPQPTVQEFQIEHIFKINPIYRDGQIDSLKGIDVPPSDIFNGDMSLKYVFQTEFRTVLTNPNTSMISDYDTQLGSVGFLDEAYNGYESVYSVEDLIYTVDGSPAERIEVGSVTHIEFTLKSSSGSFTSSTPVIFGHTAIVNSLSYSKSRDDYNKVWTDEDLRVETGDAPKTGTLIKNYTASFVDANTIDVVTDIEFTNEQSNQLSTNQDNLLYFIVQDPTKTVDTGDKVTGRVDVNFYNKNNDVAGLFDFDKFEQYPHPEDFEEGVSVGFTEALTFNESGMMADGRFWVLNTATLNSLKFDVAVYKFSDDTWDSLRSLEIDLSDQIVVGGVQQIELDTTRGYILKDGDIFNYLKVTTDTNDGTKQYYNIQVGYRIPWQSGLKFDDAPELFYDKSKSHNGLNQKASNYSMVGTGVNSFVDAIGGTFQDINTANWGLTILISGGFDSISYGRSGLGGHINWGSGLGQSGISSLFENDTALSVVEDQYYEMTTYISVENGTFDPLHLDNGSLYLLPDGYTKEECEITSFQIIEDNLYPNGTEPSFNDWKQIRTYFKAKATANIKFIFKEELQTDITTSTGFNFNMDEVNLKEVDYGIKVLFDAVVDSTNYVKTSQEIKVYDYEKDDQETDAFTCEIKTFKKNIQGEDIEIANNIIQKGYTEFRAVFKPLVPPTFSESVDFSKAADINDPEGYKRFAHGSRYIGTGGTTTARSPVPVPSGTNWLNDQADDNATFEDSDHLALATKNDNALYTSTTTTIEANENMGAFYGLYSNNEYEFYSISGKMFSMDADNDIIAYQIAFFVDEFGVEHTLSLAATTGGVLLNKNPSYNPNNTSTDIFEFSPGFPNNQASVALVYNFGKEDVQNIEQFYTDKIGFGWSSVGDLEFNVSRSGDVITASIDWTISGDNFTNTFNYNLNDNLYTNKFKGLNNIGFGFMSQDNGGFKDVDLTLPESSFYVEMKIDSKESQSDFSNSRISSHIEAPQSSLLKQITGLSRKATLAYDGTSFFGRCLIETDLIKKGQDYDLSAELRPLDLEA